MISREMPPEALGSESKRTLGKAVTGFSGNYLFAHPFAAIRIALAPDVK